MNDCPYPMVDQQLSQRLENTEGETSARFVEARARLRPTSGAACMRIASAQAMFDGPDSPLTQSFGLGIHEPVSDETLDELEAFFHSRGGPALHEVSPLAGVELLARLVARGYRPVECSSVLFRPIALELELGGERNQAISARQVSEAEYPAWSSTAAEGWSEAGDLSAFMADVVNVFAQTDCWTPFLGERNGQPIAAGSLSIVGDVALLAGASTIPAARKQGAQLALLAARLQFAAEQGCHLAMMCASPGSSSQRNAERRGFRIAYTRIKWCQDKPA